MKKKAQQLLEKLRALEVEARQIAEEAPGFALPARKIGSASDLVENWVRHAPDDKSDKK